MLRRALANSPGNERYQTLLANTEKAPELYRQIMAEMQKQEAAALRQQRGGGAKSSADGRTAENKTAKKIRTEGSAAGLLRGEGSGSLWTGPGRRIEM